MLDTYPSPAQQTQPVQVLVFGGDEPTNYFNDELGVPQEPARYTDLVDLLNDTDDGLDLTATGTADLTDINLTNLQNYDVLLYFRHNQIPQGNQDAIRDYVDGGGGLVGLHHAIYNDQNAKDTLIDLIGGELPFGVSPNNGLAYDNESNHMINVNLGHFVSTFGVQTLITQTVDYTSPLGLPNANLDNAADRGYYSFRIEADDELYLANQFNPGVTFGRGVNEINRLFANDHFMAGSPYPNNGHHDTWGWTRLYDQDGDDQVGRIVYLQPGETNDRTLAHPSYRQVIKNAVIWSANQPAPPTITLSISKKGPALVARGDVLTYTLTVTNTGSLTATNLVISDTLPAGTRYGGGGTLLDGVVYWRVASLAPNDSVSVRFRVTATQTITNDTYEVSADGLKAVSGQVSIVTAMSDHFIYLPSIFK
jgi:uncharacterized repeat protein (TIGR01451 family)